MKKILFLTVVLLALLSCKKEEPAAPVITTPATFADIQLKHIQEMESAMSATNRITILSNGKIIWKPGDVFIYKTKEGRFGKFEVMQIDATKDYVLTIKAVTFASDGKVFNQANTLNIRATYHCDLDLVAEATSATGDFQSDRPEYGFIDLEPEHNAKFASYNFVK